MKKFGLALLALLTVGTWAGCEKKPPPPAGAKTDVDVKAPGVDVKSDAGKVEVKAPGADVEVKK